MGDTNTAKQPLVLHHLDDIVVLGRYTFLVCLLAELAFLSQLSNTMYMVYADSEVSMANDLAPELSRRKRAAWGAFKSVEEVAKKTKNVRLRAHLFDSTVLPALKYALEIWAIRRQDEHAISVKRTPGASPTIRGCGNVTFASMEDACTNLHLCEGHALALDSQFYSVNEEVGHPRVHQLTSAS
ncbi:unnamed protein product [Heligmosomoides polygyrus]|uniref:Reverse transcriptase n=1 Tax=Heligmosomoides polygyrus TaxID=6339 RepID=A0A183G8I1_HELPZ|nr:unnamed protein product [Heligmosomoides polygyrus]